MLKGWKYNSLEQLASVERGKFTARPRNDPRYYGGLFPFVQTGDIAAANGLITTYSQTLNDDGLKVSKLFPKGSILITIAANIGDVAVTSFDVACPDSIVVVQSNLDVCRDWLKYVLMSKKTELDLLSTQNAQKNINLQTLRPLQILTPSLYEQKAIAEILKTWDDAIAITEKLITAKRRLKQGLTQNLITGKLQFQEFAKSKSKQKIQIGRIPANWRIAKIGEIAREVSERLAPENTTVLSCTKYDGLVPSLEYFGRQIFGENLDNYKIVKRDQFAYATNHIEEGSIGLLRDFEAGLVGATLT